MLGMIACGVDFDTVADATAKQRAQFAEWRPAALAQVTACCLRNLDNEMASSISTRRASCYRQPPINASETTVGRI